LLAEAGAGAAHRLRPRAISQSDLQAPQVVGVGGLVEDPHHRPADKAVQDRAGQLRPGRVGIEPVVGQGSLDSPLDAGGAGRAGDGHRELTAVAVVDDGHGEAEVGQGLRLMAMQVRQQSPRNLPPPIA
jgi:hypothetical protein